MSRVALGMAVITLSLLALATPTQAGLLADQLCSSTDQCTYDGPDCGQSVQELCKSESLGFCFVFVQVVALTACV